MIHLVFRFFGSFLSISIVEIGVSFVSEGVSVVFASDGLGDAFVLQIISEMQFFAGTFCR